MFQSLKVIPALLLCHTSLHGVMISKAFIYVCTSNSFYYTELIRFTDVLLTCNDHNTTNNNNI